MIVIISIFKSRYESTLRKAFPEIMNKKVSNMIYGLQSKKFKEYNGVNKHSHFEEFSLAKETVLLPRRFYLDDIKEQEFYDLDEEEKQIICCIYLLNHNGHTREKYLKILLTLDLKEWALPFLFTIASDYVKEILQTFYDAFHAEDKDNYYKFYLNNKQQVQKSYDRMLSYWNEYYRMDNLRPCIRDGRQGGKGYKEDYVGYKVFKECFGFHTRRKVRIDYDRNKGEI